MKSLLIYLKDYKKESILAPLFKMLEASFELLVPLVMAAVIDVGIADKNERYIIKMCMVLIALGLIGLVCSITAQYFSAKAASGFGTGVRHALFEHIQSLTFTEMDMIGSSTLITRLTSDINQVQNGLNLFLRLFLRSPFIVSDHDVVTILIPAPIKQSVKEALDTYFNISESTIYNDPIGFAIANGKMKPISISIEKHYNSDNP